MPQFVIIAHDDTDLDAPERRRVARPLHKTYLDTMRAEGKALCGVALLNDAGNMVGSVMVTNFPDRAAFDAYLEEEPYVVHKVWKKIEIFPGALGPTFADLIKST